MNTTRCGRARRRAWLSRPAWSRNSRASAFSGTMPSPTSLATSTTGAASAASAASSRSISAPISRRAPIRFDEPQASGNRPASAGRRASRRASASTSSSGSSIVVQRGAAARAMGGDARAPSRRRAPRRWRDRARRRRHARSALRHSGSCPSARRPAPASARGKPALDGVGGDVTLIRHDAPPLRGWSVAPARRGGLLARGRRSAAPSRRRDPSQWLHAAISPLTVAGAAPASHRTSLSLRSGDASTRRARALSCRPWRNMM